MNVSGKTRQSESRFAPGVYAVWNQKVHLQGKAVLVIIVDEIVQRVGEVLDACR
jgi:hypothetical protein